MADERVQLLEVALLALLEAEQLVGRVVVVGGGERGGRGRVTRRAAAGGDVRLSCLFFVFLNAHVNTNANVFQQ